MNEPNELTAEERKVITEMVQGAWASGSVRSPEMATLLDSILQKMSDTTPGDDDGEPSE